MNTRAKIIFGILILTTIFSIVFARIQANEAEKIAIEAEQQYARAEKAEQEALDNLDNAARAAALAREAENRSWETMKKLQECQGN